jgi:glucokinase
MEKILAIDIGGTYTRLAEINPNGHVLNKESALTVKNESDFIDGILALVEKAHVNLEEIEGVSVCIAGLINQKEGMLLSSPNIPLKNFEITKPLKEKLNKKVILLNDANAAAMGEKVWGAAKSANYFLFLTFSSGIGGAAFYDGHIVAQDNGNSIEPGHIEMNFGYDLPCGCGGEDHWESYASGINMPNFLAAWAERNGIGLDFDGSTTANIFKAIEKNNEKALNFFDQVTNVYAKGINILINKYHPVLIILGGGVYLQNEVTFKKHLVKRISEDVKLVTATYREDASLMGSAAFYLQKTTVLS